MKGPLAAISRIMLLWLLFSGIATGVPTRVIFATPNADNSLQVACALKFKELAEAYAKGRLLIDLHYSGENEEDAESLYNNAGNLHIAIIDIHHALHYAPTLGVLALPYLFTAEDQTVKLFESAFMKNTVNSAIGRSNRFQALGWLTGGFSHLANLKREVRTLKELKGLAIRTAPNPISLAAYHAFGADAVSIRESDLVYALKDETLDGMENPIKLMADQRIWEAGQFFVTENGPFVWTAVMLINASFMKSLPPELQAALRQAGEQASRYQWQWLRQENMKARQLLIAQGIQISKAKAIKEWAKTGKSLWPRFHDMIGDGNRELGKQIVEKAVAAIAKD